MIDYIFEQKKTLKNVKDIKIIPKKDYFAQHRLFTMDLLVENDSIREVIKPQRVKLWKLKDEKI